jgi:hypothetical protein
VPLEERNLRRRIRPVLSPGTLRISELLARARIMSFGFWHLRPYLRSASAVRKSFALRMQLALPEVFDHFLPNRRLLFPTHERTLGDPAKPCNLVIGPFVLGCENGRAYLEFSPDLEVDYAYVPASLFSWRQQTTRLLCGPGIAPRTRRWLQVPLENGAADPLRFNYSISARSCSINRCWSRMIWISSSGLSESRRSTSQNALLLSVFPCLLN